MTSPDLRRIFSASSPTVTDSGTRISSRRTSSGAAGGASAAGGGGGATTAAGAAGSGAGAGRNAAGGAGAAGRGGAAGGASRGGNEVTRGGEKGPAGWRDGRGGATGRSRGRKGTIFGSGFRGPAGAVGGVTAGASLTCAAGSAGGAAATVSTGASGSGCVGGTSGGSGATSTGFGLTIVATGFTSVVRGSSPSSFLGFRTRVAAFLPGPPSACQAAYDCLAARLLRRQAGLPGAWPYVGCRARLTRKASSSLGVAEYCRVGLGDGGASPLRQGGALAVAGLAAADGFLLIAADCEGYAAGSEVEIYLYGRQQHA